jgi:CheY-like chemotaxis protein
VSGTEAMLRRLTPANIRLQFDLAPGLHAIKIDSTEIEQVIVNLVVNARDAMPQGGELWIRTSEVPSDAGGWGARLSVRDTGSGMSAETQARMFEPFFTTKGIGKGTGLGLATVQGIVQQAGGRIHVESAVGQGTAFHIELPYTEDEPHGSTRPETRRPPVRRHETVLVVEDDPAVRQLAGMLLKRHGYRILEAGNPKEAKRIAADYQNEIHLLVSDIVMPDSDHRPLIEGLREARPNLPVLYISGYTDESLMAQHRLDAGTPFLQKPFTSQALLQKVDEVLAASRLP